MTEKMATHFGRIAFVGRPNVGKSTLLNHLLGQKISITSRKPQTTRQNIIGIKTLGDYQMVFVDTPGLHSHISKQLNRYMNKVAHQALFGVDIIVFIIEAGVWTNTEEDILKKIIEAKVPCVLAINKYDLIRDRASLLPFVEDISRKHSFLSIVPISAKKSYQLDVLEKILHEHLPLGGHEYTEEMVTDRSERFLILEIIREKIMRFTGEEIPYAVALEIEAYEDTETIVKMSVLIFIEKPNQKSILIGKKGEKLKQIGTEARIDIEKMLDKKVLLKLWVKVKEGWSEDAKALQALGYN
jgi:GTP-binding protein Era